MVFMCLGCHRTFSHSGYTLHGFRSANHACRVAYNDAIADGLQCDVDDGSGVTLREEESDLVSFDYVEFN